MGSWQFTALNQSTQPKTLTFEANYTGAANEPIFTHDPAWKVAYSSQYPPKEASGIENVYEKTKTACPILKPCCETCGQQYEEATFYACDDVHTVENDVVVVPKVRKLSVKLDLPEVCTHKDVNVGIFVTEVKATGEIPFAHKVIRRSAKAASGACKDDRDCDCVNFMIDDDATCPNQRVFRVRTEAHYVDAEEDFEDACTCSCMCPPKKDQK